MELKNKIKELTIIDCYRKLINVEESLQDLEWLKSNHFIRMSYKAAITILTRNGFQVNEEQRPSAELGNPYYLQLQSQL